MPPRRRGKKDSPKPRTTRTSAKLREQKLGQNLVHDSAQISALSRGLKSGLRSGLRSRPSTEFTPPFEDNPELFLRKHRTSRKSKLKKKAEELPERIPRTSPDNLSENIYSLLAEEYAQVDYAASDADPAEATSLLLQDTDSEQRFNRSWGYLPPLGEEALAVIEAVIAAPEMARRYMRIGPDHADFPEGLRNRNVLRQKSEDIDPQLDCISLLAPGELVETDSEKESHGQLWASDQAKCNKGSNEALFQRTLMMGLIARHLIIYARDSTSQCLLDFSVEEPWSCPPMPTRAYWKGESFLTQPKPDLAVCFDREALIPDHIWNDMPKATKRLACYENTGEVGGAKVSHFFTIEAKKAKVATDETVGMRQSLNNASQALHNMFEFFREAGQQHEDTFLTKVRFFSVVASTEGIAIRTHRATREPPDGSDQGFIIPEYPLRFEYREFCSIPRDKFQRQIVLEVFEKILIGYGVKELHVLLQDAAKAVVDKLREDKTGMYSRGNEDFYRYGQIDVPLSKRTTPAASRAQSIQNDVSFGSVQSGQLMAAPSSAQLGTNISFDMSRTRITTPRKGGTQAPSRVVYNGGKRPRESNAPERRVRGRNRS